LKGAPSASKLAQIETVKKPVGIFWERGHLGLMFFIFVASLSLAMAKFPILVVARRVATAAVLRESFLVTEGRRLYADPGCELGEEIGWFVVGS
jgi:hypothetical protein